MSGALETLRHGRMGDVMQFNGRSRVLRALILCAVAGVGWGSRLEAASLLTPGPAALVRRSVEPFGLFAFAVSGGSLHRKWFALRRQFDDDMVQLALCDGDRGGCVSPAALKLLAIVDAARAREGRAQLGEINRSINLAIRASSDLALHGTDDVWSSPLATFEAGAGDCEDYAIAKFAALRLAGVPLNDLRIVVLRNSASGEEHAVTSVRLEGRWLMLDNMKMAMVEDENVRHFQPLFVLYQGAVMKYVDDQIVVAPSSPAATLGPRAEAN